MTQIKKLFICRSCLNGLSDSSPARGQSSIEFLAKLGEELKLSTGVEWKLAYTGCLDLCPDGQISYLVNSSEDASTAVEGTSEFKSFKDFAGQCQRNLDSSK